MSGLARTQAQWYKQRSEPTTTESMLMDTVELGNESNPTAILELVNFYSETKQLDKIIELSVKYVTPLFQEKGIAYQSGDLGSIYRYHRVLAQIFSLEAEKTDNYGDVNDAQSAADQLTRALTIARRTGSITPDSNLITLLKKSGYPAKIRTEPNEITNRFSLPRTQNNNVIQHENVNQSNEGESQ